MASHDDLGVRGLRLEYDYNDNPADLAYRIGELLKGINQREKDSSAYRQQAGDERQKGREITSVLMQIEADPSRESLVVINPKTGTPRRMNPYLEYSIDALLEQSLQAEAKASEFEKMASDYSADISAMRVELSHVESILSGLRE
jgi:hypothetical protein